MPIVSAAAISQMGASAGHGHLQMIGVSDPSDNHCQLSTNGAGDEQKMNHQGCDYQCCSGCINVFSISSIHGVKPLRRAGSLPGGLSSPVPGFEPELRDRPPRLIL